MSLALVLANRYGIVMSADRRLTTTIVNNETGEKVSFLLTDCEQKLFLTPSGHGISYTGASSFENGIRTSTTIQNAVLGAETNNVTLHDELTLIKQRLLEVSNGKNVILSGAEILDGHNKVLSTSLISDKIVEHTDENGCCLALSGESVIAMKLTDMLPVDRNSFPLQESINYLRFLTRSVAGIQHYAQVNQTVSEECDLLVIQPSGARWITSPDDLY